MHLTKQPFYGIISWLVISSVSKRRGYHEKENHRQDHQLPHPDPDVCGERIRKDHKDERTHGEGVPVQGHRRSGLLRFDRRPDQGAGLRGGPGVRHRAERPQVRLAGGQGADRRGRHEHRLLPGRLRLRRAEDALRRGTDHHLPDQHRQLRRVHGHRLPGDRHLRHRPGGQDDQEMGVGAGRLHREGQGHPLLHLLPRRQAGGDDQGKIRDPG